MSESTAIALHSTAVGETGRTVVFLHGLFGQGRNFNQIAKGLQPELRSVMVDLPNHGRSAWTGTTDYLDVADRVAAWLGGPGGPAADGPVHLVGHSMGGKVAMVLALRHPELLDRLVVVDISPAPSSGTAEFEHLLDSLAGIDLTTLTNRREAEVQLRLPIPDDGVRQFLLTNLRNGPEGFAWRANLALLRSELPEIGGFPEVEATFDHPVLWIAGERSDYVRADHALAMRRLFPRTRSVTIKGAGHWVHSEQPEAFTSALRVFLTAGEPQERP